MSFPSNFQPLKYSQPQNNLSSPNLNNNFKRSELTIQLEKNSQAPIDTDPFSQRPITNLAFGQISNDFYTSGTSRQMNGDNKGKINEMSSDLAKLKQQLSKIMSQAGTLEKRPVATDQANSIKTSQQVTFQSFNQVRYTEEGANSVNISINKSQEKSLNPNLGKSPKSYQRITESSKQIPMFQLPSVSVKPLLMSPNSGEKKQENFIHRENQKTFGINVSNFLNDAHSQELNNLEKQSKGLKNSEQNSSDYYFGKDYDLKFDHKPVLRVRDEGNQVSLNNTKNSISKPMNEQQFTKQTTIEKQKLLLQSQSPKKPQSPSKHEPFTFYSPPSLTKKSSSNFSHQLIVNRIVNEELSKKIEESMEMKQLKKKKQEEEYQYQEKIIELEHEKRKLKHELNSILLEKENLQMALKTEKAQKEALNKKYFELEEVFKTTKFQLQDSKTRYKLLQRKLQPQISRPKIITEPLSFDEALRQQIAQITNLKQQLEDKDQEIMRVKEINTSHRREIQSLHNQIKIEQLKAASQVNECEQKHSILIQDKENQIKTMKNLVITLESKLDCAIKENKTKDAFMVQHLTGKTKLGQEKEYIENFFKHYEIQFPTNKIADKLKQELTEIERLKKTILQMAGNKI